jgi:hypothetical protein
MTGKDNPSLGEMIAEDLRRRLIELEAEVQVGFPGAQHRLDAVRSLLNLWNSFAWEHILKRSDLVPPAAFELQPVSEKIRSICGDGAETARYPRLAFELSQDSGEFAERRKAACRMKG